MEGKKTARFPLFLLCLTLFLCICCTLCSSWYTIFGQYGSGPLLQLADLQHGILHLNGNGSAYAVIGFSIIGILSAVTFAHARLAYRRKEMGKQPMIWALLLFVVAVLVVAGSLTIYISSSCTEYPEGSDDTLYCTYSLPSGILSSSHGH